MGTGSTLGLAAEQIGIVPRVFDFIFDEVENRQRQSEFNTYSLKIQFLELYGEEMHDLLDPAGSEGKQIMIREEPKSGQISVTGLKAEEVTSKNECLDYLNKGISRRVTTSNNMNEQSSRSHAIFTLTITQKITKVMQNPDGPDQEPIT